MTRDEKMTLLEEYGATCSAPFTAAEMLRGQVPIARLHNHEVLRPFVEEERRKRHRKRLNSHDPADYFDV
jgi:hypothetical protein